MDKQENFNFNNLKHNKISLFLTRFLFNENMEMLRKTGFIDSFTKDKNTDLSIFNLDESKKLFLLFKSKKLGLFDIINIIKELVSIEIHVLCKYDLFDDYQMVVIDFPKEFNSDYDNIVDGKYSKLSSKFKASFPETEDVFNEKKVRIGKRHTIYYHIFNKTEWLQNYWKTKLNLIELDDKLELWTKPLEQDLVFDIKNYIKN